MEIKPVVDKIGQFIKKNQYIFLIVIIGLILLIIPSRSKKEETDAVVVQESEHPSENLEFTLSELLSKVKGAGKVEVLLTLNTGEEQLFQTNETNHGSQDTTNKQTDTVIITNSNHNQTGLVRKTLAPIYRGAVVICEGADNPSVQLAIVDAVSNATGLSTNRISVLKMK